MTEEQQQPPQQCEEGEEEEREGDARQLVHVVEREVVVVRQALRPHPFQVDGRQSQPAEAEDGDRDLPMNTAVEPNTGWTDGPIEARSAADSICSGRMAAAEDGARDLR